MCGTCYWLLETSEQERKADIYKLATVAWPARRPKSFGIIYMTAKGKKKTPWAQLIMNPLKLKKKKKKRH